MVEEEEMVVAMGMEEEVKKVQGDLSEELVVLEEVAHLVLMQTVHGMVLEDVVVEMVEVVEMEE